MPVTEDRQNYKELGIRIPMGPLDVTMLYVGFEPSVPGWGYAEHEHSTWEFHYVPEGRGVLIVEGREYAIGPGTFYLTGPGLAHLQRADSREAMIEYCVNLELRPARKRQRKTDARFGSDSDSLMKKLMTTRFWFGWDEAATWQRIRDILLELKTSRPGFRSSVQVHLAALVLQAARTVDGRMAVGKATSLEVPDDARLFILDESFRGNPAELTPLLLAERIGTSVRQLDRQMLRFYGMTFREKRRMARMALARNLLAERGKTLSEIAEACGFSSLAHFSRVFRNEAGESPSAYRRSR